MIDPLLFNNQYRDSYDLQDMKPAPLVLAILVIGAIGIVIGEYGVYQGWCSTAVCYDVVAFVAIVTMLGLIKKKEAPEKQIIPITGAAHQLFPQSALPLPDELIQKIWDSLPIKESGTLALLNKNGKQQAKVLQLNRAKRYGFTGEDPATAATYLASWFKHVTVLARVGFVLSVYQYPNPRNFDAEATWFDFMSMSEKSRRAIKEHWEDLVLQLGNLEEIEALLVWGADKEEKRRLITHGRLFLPSSLGYALYRNQKEIALLFIKYQADVNAIFSKPTCTILHMLVWGACQKKNRLEWLILDFHDDRPSLEMIELCLSNGANVNARTNTGMTALHIAAGYQREDLVTCLIRYGADTQASTKAGKKPRDFAKSLQLKTMLE